MGVRERKVEQYLDKSINDIGGLTRKWVSPGRDGVMDRICFVNPEWYVEVKTVEGSLSKNQRREAARLIKAGARVAVVYGNESIDKFIEWLRTNKDSQPQVQVVFK